MADIQLLICNPADSSSPSRENRFGGAPSVGPEFSWPTCAFCNGNMQFLGQIRSPGTDCLDLIFMCQNRPGVCWEWDPDRGGNRVICTTIDGLTPADIPSKGETTRNTRYGARIEGVRAGNYDAARGAWGQRHPGRQRDVLGQIGGSPAWLQGDETPVCTHCSKPMRLVAQLEEGPHYDTGMNFAGGCGYVFRCDCAGGVGKFLWQG